MHHYGDTWSLSGALQRIKCRLSDLSLQDLWYIGLCLDLTGSCQPPAQQAACPSALQIVCWFLWCGARILLQLMCQWTGTGARASGHVSQTHIGGNGQIEKLSLCNWWLGCKYSINALFIKLVSWFSWVDMSALVWLILGVNMTACHFMVAFMLSKQNTHTHANVHKTSPDFYLDFCLSVEHWSLTLPHSKKAH